MVVSAGVVPLAATMQVPFLVQLLSTIMLATTARIANPVSLVRVRSFPIASILLPAPTRVAVRTRS